MGQQLRQLLPVGVGEADLGDRPRPPNPAVSDGRIALLSYFMDGPGGLWRLDRLRRAGSDQMSLIRSAHSESARISRTAALACACVQASEVGVGCSELATRLPRLSLESFTGHWTDW